MHTLNNTANTKNKFGKRIISKILSRNTCTRLLSMFDVTNRTHPNTTNTVTNLRDYEWHTTVLRILRGHGSHNTNIKMYVCV